MKLHFITVALSLIAVLQLPAADAVDRDHFAFKPVVRPEVPANSNAIDHFIRKALDAQGMKPARPATKETLLRRVTFDLIGLPPTTDELRDFLADKSPEAFAKVVDRLLKSPHFGERWGRHWLDTARYSDTAGQQTLTTRDGYRYPYAWAYRDYVINCYNDDKPYDQFIIEQLAADRLPQGKDNPSVLAALGFLTVGERFQNNNDVINDRIDTVTKAFLGLTVACSRCHDHKFDPVPTEDYYSLHGIFASSLEPEERPRIAMSKDANLFADYQAKLAKLEDENATIYFQTIADINASFRQDAASYMLRLNTGGRGMTREQANEMMSMKSREQLQKELRVISSITPRMSPSDAVWGPWLLFRARSADDLATNGASYAAEVASNPGSATTYGWNAVLAAEFKGKAPKSMENVAAIYAAAFKRVESQAEAYFAAKRRASTNSVPGFDPAVAELLEKPLALIPGATLNTEKLTAALTQFGRNMRQIAPFKLDEINELEISHPAAPARAMAMIDSSAPKNSPVFVRGQAEVSRNAVGVPRRFLEILSDNDRPVFKEGSGRLELAQAIASKSNPMTARVQVNRIWMHLFGEGFVPTPDNLGVQAEAPSHPELLDWLASEFMAKGWSQKAIIREIVMSATYQQSGDDNADYAKRDPHNRLLWHASLRKLDFESMRDSLLVFSGKLDPQRGGKPINLTDEPYSYRRSVYGYVDRGNLPELMQQFDFPDPDMTNSKRASTVVPQQALFLMNSPMIIDVARAMVARREFTEARDDVGRVEALYRIVFQRMPQAAEANVGMDFVSEALEDTTTEIIADSRRGQPQRRPEGGRAGTQAPVHNQGEVVSRQPLSAWERYAQALLFANEIMYVN
ncbi:MAG: DUF1549 and DUF1553 domain-containing protein [Verrucomicrobiaceae bacterium]|nr:DUF1549 and DUF1553 domain-containing protein [Verrucomicrobiaceae bacterium]